MDVTVLCSTLLINALIFLVAEDQFSCAERADATSLRILPNKLQFFEYDSISCDCEGFDNFTEWRVMRTMKGVKTTCAAHWETSWGPCLIQHAYPLDSGEYWCETKEGEKSNSVFISVTAGSVILESPALPVTEGDAVTLRCKNRMTSSDCIADFYKNGSRTGTGYKGNITIHNVSKSDEGLYKCIIADEESAESWLAVRVSPSLYEETHPSYSRSSGLLLLIVTLSSCLATLLLLGFCLCAEHRVNHSPRPQSAETQTASEPTSEGQPQTTTCSSNTPDSFCTAGASIFTATPVSDAPSAGGDQTETAEYTFYYTID